MEQQLPHLRFDSRIRGRNAQVTVYGDRIEWVRPAYGTAAKVALWVLALYTIGLSLLLPSCRPWRRAETQMMAVRAMAGVTSHPDGPLSTEIIVQGGGALLAMRVANGRADEIRNTLQRLIVGGSAPSRAQL